MGEMEPKVSRRRGQRLSSLDLPQRFVDHLTSDGLEIPNYGHELHKVGGIDSEPDILTLERLFNRYYSARQAEGAAERTLQDYLKHMVPTIFKRRVQRSRQLCTESRGYSFMDFAYADGPKVEAIHH